MKLIDLIKAKKVFAEHLQEKIPTALAYKIFKLVKFADENDEFYISKVQALLNECGEKGDNGEFITGKAGGIKISENAKIAWENGIKEIDNLEIETPDFIFTIAELSPLNLSVQEIINIQNLIKEE